MFRVISLLRCCFAAFPFISEYWNTSMRAFIHKIWKVASWRFNCQYARLRSINALCGSSELAFERLQSWQIWSEKWFRRCIITILESNSCTRFCAISHLICIFSPATQPHFAAAERLLDAGWLSRSSCLPTVSCNCKASEAFFGDILARNQLKTSLWQWYSSRYFSMNSIVAEVRYQYCAVRWKVTEFLMQNRASVNGILRLTEAIERVTMKTGTITPLSAFISLPLYFVTWLHSLLNWAKPWYRGVITQSWLKLSILECSSRKDVTQSIRCLSIPR